METYYDKRAEEYERIYFRNDPVRQAEQAALAKQMGSLFLNRKVLEVACGTCFWTERAALIQ